MTSIRQFTMNDLFYFNNVNLDVLTETYNLQFYMQYMTYWPESFIVAKTATTTTTTGTHYKQNQSIDGDTRKMNTHNITNNHNNDDVPGDNHHSMLSNNSNNSDATIMGYLLGKAEGEERLWHGHVSAITISKYYRRISMAKYLMQQFETTICTYQKQNFFVDLFVRASNTLAIQMYHNFGYRIYRRVIGYYQSSSGNPNRSGSDPPPEDAYDMRKSLPRDPQQLSMIPLPHPVYPEDLEW
jgi:N-terminal acetyltransferase B complex catalytic subunit